jgi:SAM-dependent methyltransferase
MSAISDLEFSLLNNNLQRFTEFDREVVENDIARYYANTSRDWDDVYGHVENLSGWANSTYFFPNLHIHHKKIVDTVARLGARDVCEVGAGAGSVSKHVYASTGANMTCLEGSDFHIAQMRENFSKESDIISPKIDVPANIVKGNIQHAPIADNQFDLVYTCTVMMHIPFLVIPRAALEIKRISKKYILHVENRNDVINCVHIPGDQKLALNYLCIDYRGMYEAIGVKTVAYEEYRDPHAECTYVMYLGEKV